MFVNQLVSGDKNSTVFAPTRLPSSTQGPNKQPAVAAVALTVLAPSETVTTEVTLAKKPVGASPEKASATKVGCVLENDLLFQASETRSGSTPPPAKRQKTESTTTTHTPAKAPATENAVSKETSSEAAIASKKEQIRVDFERWGRTFHPKPSRLVRLFYPEQKVVELFQEEKAKFLSKLEKARTSAELIAVLKKNSAALEGFKSKADDATGRSIDSIVLLANKHLASFM